MLQFYSLGMFYTGKGPALAHGGPGQGSATLLIIALGRRPGGRWSLAQHGTGALPPRCWETAQTPAGHGAATHQQARSL